MKEKTKEILKKNLIGFILGVVSACTISVIAATYFPSNDVTYDNSESGLTSTNVQGAIDELYTECTKEPTAGETIIENAGLEKDPYECRYFFTGANPNNYITFNGENASWRIVSVECDGTIKIMRTESIGNMAWDTGNSSNWARPASLNTYLNSTYYNGLNSTAQNQIVAKDWNIGRVTNNNSNLENQINEENSTKWNGKIALITLSEYLRSNSSTNCKVLNNYKKNYKTCKNSIWMYIDDYWWILSPYNNTNWSGVQNVGYVIMKDGYITSGDSTVTGANSIRPALYLSSEVKITGGDGSKSNPYTIE